MDYRQLPNELRPLLDKFYRQQPGSMRASADAQYWVAQQDEIVAALNLNPLHTGFWLTGLLVAPSHRGQGVASVLVAHALADQPQPVWLFCHPSLQTFYQRLGFTLAQQLPAQLSQRLARYQQSKTLLALEKLTENRSNNLL